MAFDNLVNQIIGDRNLTYITDALLIYSLQAAMWVAIFLPAALLAGLISIIPYAFKGRGARVRPSVQFQALMSNNPDESKNLSFSDIKDIESDTNSKKSIITTIFQIISIILYIISILWLCLSLSILSSGDLISIAWSIIIPLIMFLFLQLILIQIFCPSKVRSTIKQKNLTFVNSKRSNYSKQIYCAFKLHPFLFLAIPIFGFIYSVSLPLMTANSCLAYFQQNIGFQYEDYIVTTAFTRWFALSKVCPDGKICHLYSTLPEDASTGVFLNVHTGVDVTELQAAYDTTENFKKTGKLPNTRNGLDLMMNVDSTGSRYIHSIYLYNLTANTSYYVQLLWNGNSIGDANFTTFPDPNGMESNIVMGMGGDSSGNDRSSDFVKFIGDYDPDVFLVGGDITYDNGDFDCYYCWDYFLGFFEQINQRRGKLVPIILTLGNHDIGQDGYQFLEVNPYENYFFLLFPQHARVNSTTPEVPPPEERLSYFYHIIGNTLHVTLDTGYMLTYDAQNDWLKNVSNTTLPAKFANLHVPVFPACFYHPDEWGYDPRFYTWIKTFEQYKYMTVFENHVHLFKRTFPLKYYEKDGPGVVYIGDGAWGADIDPCYFDDPNRNITGVFEVMAPLNHVWVVNISNDKVDYFAINTTGHKLDSYSQSIADYQ